MSSTPQILVLYYSRHGSVKSLAQQIAKGIEAEGCEALLRTVPQISSEAEINTVPTSGDPFVSKADLKSCAGLAMGSPVRFGNMAAELKYFWDSTTTEWIAGTLVDKPASVFTSSASLHGGNESTLLSMMLPLYHHGMLVMGLPYTEPELSTTSSGGTPYGASHTAGMTNSTELSEEEIKLAIAQGKRLAQISKSLLLK